MSWTAFEKRASHDLVWTAEIGGLGIRLTSHPKLAPKTLPKLSGDYVDHVAIAGVGEVGGTLPLLGGRAEHTTCKLTVNVPPRSPLLAIFNRATPFDAPHARIMSLIEHSDAPGAVVHLDRDPVVAFGEFPRIVHHAREAWRATAAGTEVGGADPYRVTATHRAVYGTQPEQTTGAKMADAVRPYLMGEMTAWRGQRIVIYVAVIQGNGKPSPLMEYMRGTLGGPPEWIDGKQMSLAVAPLSAKLDQKVVGSLPTVGLLDDVHATAGDAAYVFEHAQRARAGGLWRSTTDAQSLFAAPVLNSVGAAKQLEAHSDFALEKGHPRYGAVNLSSLNVDASGGADMVHLGVVAAGITIEGGLRSNVEAAQQVRNGEIIECKRAEMVAPGASVQIFAWPGDYIDAINDEWSADGRNGIAGAFLSVRVGIDAGGLHLTTEPTDPHPSVIDLQLWSAWDRAGGPEAPQVWTADGPQHRAADALCWYPLSWAAPNDPRSGHAAADASEAERLAARDWFRVVEVTHPDQRIDCRGPVPTAWVQEGEAGALLTGPVTVPAGGTAALRITYTDPGAQPRAHIVRVTSCTPLGDGFYVTWHPDDRRKVPSFGNWPGHEKAKLEPIIYTEPEPPGRAILRLLLSGAGEQVNHGFDTLAFGLNLAAADVDLASFAALTAPAPFNECRLILTGDDTAADIIDDILKATSSAIAMVRSDLGHRLTLIRLGAPSRLRAIGVVAHPFNDGRPRTRWRNEVTNSLDLRINHDDDGLGEAQAVINAPHQASRAAYGERESIEIEARGVQLPGLGAEEGVDLAVGMVARIGSVAGFLRREWAGRYSLMEAMRMTLGGVYLLTDRDFLDYGAKEAGVVAVPVRLIGLVLNAWSGEVEATFARFPIEGGGINASARIVEVIDEVTVRVNPTMYVPPTNPMDGLPFTAAEAFSAGSVCRLMPAGDWAASVTRTVTAIDIATQHSTMSAPHGLPIGPFDGIVRPPPRSQAVGIHRKLAFQADANGLLDASTPSQERGVYWT